MHEVFLLRLVCHPVFREDQNLQVFLEYEQDVSTICIRTNGAADDPEQVMEGEGHRQLQVCSQGH